MEPGARTVLLVEDDHEVAILVGELLSLLGCEVVRAESAAAALGVLQQGQAVDVVLSDVVMPGGMDGLALAREIRRLRPNLPVILTTGNALAIEQQAQAGRFLLLPKPYGAAELGEMLEQASGGSSGS